MRFILSLLLMLLCSPTHAEMASWYGNEHGQWRTSTGERYHADGFTCASRRYSIGAVLVVTYRGRSATCRVNDRGPYARNRDLDVSRGVARAIGLLHAGVGHVSVRRIR